MTEPAGIEQTAAPVEQAEAPTPTCRNGHPWTEENTLRRVSSGKQIRQCRTCARLASKARAERKAAAAQAPEPIESAAS